MSLVGDMEEVSEMLDEQSDALKALLEGSRMSRANVEHVLNRPEVRFTTAVCVPVACLIQKRAAVMPMTCKYCTFWPFWTHWC